MPPRNIKFTIQYDGTEFHGWQRQTGVRTVQGELEQALAHILQTPVPSEGASRTDAGVHALGQAANFVTESSLTPGRLAAAVNARLPDDMAVVGASEVPPEFSSRFSARGKIYHYLILNTQPASPLMRRRALHVPGPLDISAMSAAAAFIAGERDYAAFGAKASHQDAEKNTVCSIDGVSVSVISFPLLSEDSGGLIRIEVQGDRFLYKMVRAIAGTLIETGKGKLSPDEIIGIIESGDRKLAGPTAAPHGLYLIKVLY